MHVGVRFFMCICVRVSQCTEVVAGAGFLPEDPAAPLAAHLTVAAPVPFPVSAVRARHQPGQEALGPARQALSAACPELAVGPAGAHAVTSGCPNCCLQQLLCAVVQRGRQLQVKAVKHCGTGLGLWCRDRKTIKI